MVWTTNRIKLLGDMLVYVLKNVVLRAGLWLTDINIYNVNAKITMHKDACENYTSHSTTCLNLKTHSKLARRPGVALGYDLTGSFLGDQRSPCTRTYVQNDYKLPCSVLTHYVCNDYKLPYSVLTHAIPGRRETTVIRVNAQEVQDCYKLFSRQRTQAL